MLTSTDTIAVLRNANKYDNTNFRVTDIDSVSVVLQEIIITSYIDAPQAYGSKSNLATRLRSKGGRLDVGPSVGQPIPLNDPETFYRTVNTEEVPCSLAGDARSNENHGERHSY